MYSKAKVCIPLDATCYPAEAYQFQDSIVEIESINNNPLRPYIIITKKSGVQGWGDWFYLEHIKFLDDSSKNCTCQTKLLIAQGCKCGGI